MMKKALMLFTAGIGFLFADNFINLQITNDTIMTEGQYNINSTQPIYVRGGYLINNNKSNLFYAGIKSEGQIIGIDAPVKFSLFADYINTKNNSAIPVGIGASMFLKYFTLPVFARGEFEYAPEVLSFDDAKKCIKYKAEIGAQFIENGEVFAGYRHITFNTNYNSSVYVGVGFLF